MEPTQGTLPPPPPPVHDRLAPEMQRVPMDRRDIGKKGQSIKLLTNHFNVRVANTDGYFFHYSVSITYEDGTPVDAKGIGRKVLDKVRETYQRELSGKHFAYDGEKSLFTVGSLPSNVLEFTVVMENAYSNISAGHGSPEGDGNGSPSGTDRKRIRRPPRSKIYKVAINYAARIPMQAIANALRGIDSEQFQEAVRVLDIILRQNAAAKPGCLLVRQSFFHNQPRNFIELGGGVLGCRGFHSSFRPTQNGLSLNMDVATTMIVRPGPVVDFLMQNQNVRDPYGVDWLKAKRMLKNLIVTNTVTKLEQKVTGLSDKKCKEQTFSMKPRKEDGDSQPIELTVYEYFVTIRNIPLRFSGDFPCINVGKPKRPTFIPLELCELVSLQRYTKALSSQQRASLVEKSRQKPQERMNILDDAMKSSNYNANTLLTSSGVNISSQLTSVNGRVLSAPKLKVGNGEDCSPKNGRWNFNSKKLVEPVKIKRWAVVNFSARVDLPRLVRDLMRCGEAKGISFEHPFNHHFEEKPEDRRASSPDRVEKMFENLKEKLPGVPEFLLCILPERKNSDLYGPWKRKNLCEFGIVTQCIAPARFNDQYLTNVVLKINAKMGGMNSVIAFEGENRLPVVSRAPTIIIGMDVSHGSPGRADVPSIAAVVSSTGRPLVSRYRAEVRTQPPKTEMIESLYKEISETKDDGKTETKDEGIFRELIDFYESSNAVKPEQIIIFRDGVSESQFNQLLNDEFNQIHQACKHLDKTWKPKFTLLVAQKNHHTKFFQVGQVGPNSNYNVPPGTLVDTGICHPRNNDFYLCAHAGMIGTSRPTHYHVLHDDIGFQPDELQELVNSLSYDYQRSTTAISVVAPICYAHLAASQVSQFMKFDDFSDASSSHSGVTSTSRAVPELPKLHPNVSSSMFFC